MAAYPASAEMANTTLSPAEMPPIPLEVYAQHISLLQNHISVLNETAAAIRRDAEASSAPREPPLEQLVVLDNMVTRSLDTLEQATKAQKIAVAWSRKMAKARTEKFNPQYHKSQPLPVLAKRGNAHGHDTHSSPVDNSEFRTSKRQRITEPDTMPTISREDSLASEPLVEEDDIVSQVEARLALLRARRSKRVEESMENKATKLSSEEDETVSKRKRQSLDSVQSTGSDGQARPGQSDKPPAKKWRKVYGPYQTASRHQTPPTSMPRNPRPGTRSGRIAQLRAWSARVKATIDSHPAMDEDFTSSVATLRERADSVVNQLHATMVDGSANG